MYCFSYASPGSNCNWLNILIPSLQLHSIFDMYTKYLKKMEAWNQTVVAREATRTVDYVQDWLTLFYSSLIQYLTDICSKVIAIAPRQT